MSATLARTPRPASAPQTETVLSVTHYTESLFSLRITRPQGLRFRSGEFVMLGLPQEDGRPLLRAYSIASPNWDDALEFYSIKVPGGPLTSRLARVAPGDEVILKPRATGTLVGDALIPGGTLWLISTGTGFAPFASIVRDPDTYERFGHVVLTHTARRSGELAYSAGVVEAIAADPLLAEMVGDRLTFLTSLTREPTTGLAGRITHLIASGALYRAAGRPAWSAERDRVMICGSAQMIADTRQLAQAAGLAEGSNAKPGGFVVEKAFVG